MKSLVLIFMAAATVALTSCTSTPTHVDKTVHAQTFSFVNNGRPMPNFAEGRAQALQMIQEAITKNMAAKGVNKVDSGGDVTVGFLVIVGNNAQTEAINTYFGDAEAADALHEKAQDAYTSNKDPNQFEAGTLVIDIIDGKNYKLLVRNYGTRQIMTNITEQGRADRIQELVDEILKNVHVEH